MKRVLMIDRDRAAMQELGLACLGRGVGVVIADNLCDGVRALLSTRVAVVAVERALLRLTAAESAALFERVAPGVPVTVVLGADAPLATRVAFEVQGFRVLGRPVGVDDLLDKTAAGGTTPTGP